MKITNERKLYIEFAIGCALRVLPMFETKYPDKKAPRLALEAAKTFLLNPTKKNKAAADAAAYAAAAADAAYPAADAAYAAYAAYAAAYATAYADAAYPAADAAYAAADAAAERKWQVGFLAYLNFKYSLKIEITGVK